MHNLPFQLMNKIGLLSPELKNDIALYKAAFEAEELKAAKEAFKEYHTVEISSNGPTHAWRFSTLGELFLLGIRSSEFRSKSKKINTSLRGC